MRSINSIKNAVIAIITNIITVLVGVVTQALFLKLLGDEYSGINGLFTTILSMLAIVELGFGSAIIYHLYKPVHDGDKESIKSLMEFYRKTYNVIAGFILLLGFLVMPFIHVIVGEVNIPDNLYFIFFLYIVDVVVSYLLTYKRSILYADQKTYIMNLVHIGYLVFMNAIQICLLLVYQNFIVYLFIKILFRFLENLVITLIANRRYPYILDKDIKPIDPEIKTDIVTKVKGLFFHKIGSFVVMGTDNIIISMLLGVKMVAVYTNYRLIINALNDLLSQVFSSLTASVGNLLVEDNHSHNYTVYKRLYLLNSWICMWTTTCVFCIASPFIGLVYGKKYIIPMIVLLVICLNFYITGMRRVYAIFKEAAGIFHEDRFVPIIESIINIVASVILVLLTRKYGLVYGLLGVFTGTIISSLVLYLYSFPKYVYLTIFKKHFGEYIKELLKHVMLAFITLGITYYVTTLVVVDNFFLQVVINSCICILVPNIIYLVIFFRSNDFRYFVDMFKNMFVKILRRN